MTRTSIGSYKVTRRQETEGEIYLARSNRGARCLLRMVAHPGEEVWARMKREAAIISSLDHPAIGKVVDSLEDGDQLAIVTEPVDGVTLDQLVDRFGMNGARLEPTAVWHLGHQLAGALAQAHAAGDDDILAVCHGHLAPAAVAIAWNGFVRVDGLGLGPLVEAGVISAMAGFSAPESRVTPRGDVYAFGALLWALLTGTRPSGTLGIGDHGLRDLLPASFRDAFEQCLEPALGKRRITSFELEQFMSELASPVGKTALAAAIAALRRGGSLSAVVARRPASQPPSAVGGVRKRTSSSAMRRMPLRSKQATLVGAAAVPPPRAKLESKPSAIDWDAATQAARRPSVPPGIVDDVSWGDDEDAPTPPPIPVAPAADPMRALQVPRPAARNEMAAKSNAIERLDDQDMAEALELEAEALVELGDEERDDLGGALPSPGASPSRDDVTELDEADVDIAILSAATVSADHPEASPLEPSREPSGADESSSDPVVLAAPRAPEPAASLDEGAVRGSLGQPAAGADAVRVASSPWSRDEEPDEPATLSWSTAVLLFLASLAVTMAVGIWWVRRSSEPVAPPELPVAPASASGTPTPVPMASSTAAKPLPSATASASATPDGSSLAPDRGYLVVKFVENADADVYFRQELQGKVNRRLAVDCKAAHFVRIGKGQPPMWLTDGRPGVKATCQSTTEITMRPPLR